VAFAFASVSSAKTIYVPDDYENIQWAVDNASAGDTIIVRDGVYYENVFVDKQLKIKSENGSANCVVNAADLYDDVFYITADYVEISGFTIKGAEDAGINLFEGDYCIISNNSIKNNYWGINLHYSNNNTISGNIIENNYIGIYIRDYSNKNKILENRIENNWVGIYIRDSNNCIISGNIFINDGLLVIDSYKNKVYNNTVNGKPLVYLEYESDLNVNDAGQVILVNCNNITVKNLNLSNTNDGVQLWQSDNCIISENSIENNVNGIYIWCSNNNTISGNSIIENNVNGIYIWGSNNNTISENNIENNECGIQIGSSNKNIIYLNNFKNNTNHVYSYASTNIWNSTEMITYKYKGKQYTNYTGNYWSDYTGSDTNGDGIGDTPYSIYGDKDYHPLMKTFENYFAPEQKPSVSISTDKYEYKAEDVMLINITLMNPKDEWQSVKFLFCLDIFDYNLHITIIKNRSLRLPPHCNKTFKIRWNIPEFKFSFNASWYVAIFNERTSELISEDYAYWRYIAAKEEAMTKYKKELSKSVREIKIPF